MKKPRLALIELSRRDDENRWAVGFQKADGWSMFQREWVMPDQPKWDGKKDDKTCREWDVLLLKQTRKVLSEMIASLEKAL